MPVRARQDPPKFQQKELSMSYEDDHRREELERKIRRNQRNLNDPYVQDKWVEREAIEKARRELREIERRNGRS